MSREVHQDEGGFLIGSCQGCGVGQGLPSSHMVLDLPIIEGRDEPLDEEDVVPRGGIWVGQMIEHPHPGMKLLDRLVGELNHAGKLSPQQLRVTLGEEPLLILVQSLLRRFGSGDRNVHDGFQGRSLLVRIHELFGFVVGPAVVIDDDLELGTPSQKVFSREVQKVQNLSVMGAWSPLEGPIGLLLASFV